METKLTSNQKDDQYKNDRRRMPACQGMMGLTLLFISVFINISCSHLPHTDEPQSVYLKQIKSQYLATNGFIIHYIHAGAGDPVILIHGGGTWLYSFRHNFTELSKYFSVYALDMPGHGYTQLAGSNFTWDLEGTNRILKGFMDQLDLKRVSLVGHSWGGGWALRFAQCYPNRVNKLVLMGASGFDVPDVFEWELLKYPLMGPLLTQFISEGNVRMGLEQTFYSSSIVTEQMVQEINIPLTIEANRKAQYLFARGLDWQITEKALPTTSTPTLILWGKNDQYLGVELAERFARQMPDSRKVILENCGHSIHEELPERVNRLLIDYLKPHADKAGISRSNNDKIPESHCEFNAG